MRSKWSEAVPSHRPTQSEHSTIEHLAEERHQYVFEQLKQAHQTKASLSTCLLLFILAESILLAGLALTPDNIFGGSSLLNLMLRLFYALGAGVAGLFLLVSLAFAAFGVIYISRDSLTSSLPPGALTRQKIYSLALAELAQLHQALKRAHRLFRWAAILFLIALFPYLLALAVLILQAI